LYLRQKEIDKLEAKYQRKFKKKTELIVETVTRLEPKFKESEKNIEVIIDGGYAKDTVLLPLANSIIL
jgi:ADP-ribosylglycohydrolase